MPSTPNSMNLVLVGVVSIAYPISFALFFVPHLHDTAYMYREQNASNAKKVLFATRLLTVSTFKKKKKK